MSRTVLPAQHRFVLHSASGSVITGEAAVLVCSSTVSCVFSRDPLTVLRALLAGFILTASRTSVFQASQAQANMQRR